MLSAMMALLTTGLTQAATLIAGVPSYSWYHGCEPTSIGMILGYWDMKGYSNLFAAEGSSVYLTSSVQDEISSPLHNYVYEGVDKVGITVPLTSIADALGTSKDPLSDGTSYIIK